MSTAPLDLRSWLTGYRQTYHDVESRVNVSAVLLFRQKCEAKDQSKAEDGTRIKVGVRRDRAR